MDKNKVKTALKKLCRKYRKKKHKKRCRSKRR